MPRPKTKSARRFGQKMPSRMQASYEGAGQGSRTKAWHADSAGPTAVVVSGLQTMRNRSRAAVRDNPYAFGAIDKLVSNEIGTGITALSAWPEIDQLWKWWIKECDADGLLDFYGLQALISRTTHTAGECFVRLRPRLESDGLCVPLQLQVLEPEFVPHWLFRLEPNGNSIRAGIEFNRIGKRVAYWMYPRHPGDVDASMVSNELIRVPAETVIHVQDPQRPGQLRGVPTLAPVLLLLKNLDDFRDAVLFRQEVANLFAGFIRKPVAEDPLDLDDKEEGVDAVEAIPMVSLEPGTMQELDPGEEVEFSTPPDAGNNYADFMRQELLAAAVGVGVPYETLTGDLQGVSDRQLRVTLNEFRRRLEQRQWLIYIPFCDRVRTAWLDMAVLAGKLNLPGYAKKWREYAETTWVPQGWPYLQPVQDVQAKALEIQNGLASRTAVVRRTGDNAEQVDIENAADQARAKRLGLQYGTATAAKSEDPEKEPTP